MGKMAVILGSLMVAGGGAFGLYEYTNLFGNNPNGCCLKSHACCASSPCCVEDESAGCCPASACCPASPCCESPAAGAVAGPMAFVSAPAKTPGCCEAGAACCAAGAACCDAPGGAIAGPAAFVGTTTKAKAACCETTSATAK